MDVGGFINKALAPIAPRWAFNREVARQRFRALSTYAAAERSRRTRDWNPAEKSADAALIPDIPRMNARARQMVRDNPYARSAVRSFVRNVVGKGIKPSASATFRGGGMRTAFNRQANDLFLRWATDPLACDVEGRKTFFDMQRQVIENLATVGEFLFVKVAADNGPDLPAFRLMAIEPEQFDMTLTSHTNGNEVRGGVEIDGSGRAVAYHLYRRTPGDLTYPIKNLWQTERIEASRVLHIYIQSRPGQTRGESWMAPSLRAMWDLESYDDATRMVARMEACIGVIIKRNPGPPTVDGGLNGPDGESTTDTRGNRLWNFEPGMVAELEEGEEAQAFSPERPGNQYADFTRQQLRMIGSGFGLSYEQLARDFTNGNFSSQRQALLEDRREWGVIQQFVIEHFCQPVWEEALMLADLQGLIASATFNQDYASHCKCMWKPQGWDWIDPLKEANAAKVALEQRITTRQAILTEKGQTVEDTFGQLEVENDLAERHGVTLPEQSIAAPATPATNTPQADDSADDPAADDEDEDMPTQQSSRMQELFA